MEGFDTAASVNDPWKNLNDDFNPLILNILRIVLESGSVAGDVGGRNPKFI